MQLRNSNVVITGGADCFATVLAGCLGKAKANVILVDDPSPELERSAEKAGAWALGMTLDARDKWIRLIGKVYNRCRHLDYWIFHWPGIAGGDPRTPLPATNGLWQERVLLQMYLSRYLLERMGSCGKGHIVTAVPWAGLYAPFVLRDYWVDKHAGLHFSERLAALGRDKGITVSARCIGTPLPEGLPDRRSFGVLLRRRAGYVIDCIQQRIFLIDDSACSFPVDRTGVAGGRPDDHSQRLVTGDIAHQPAV